MQIEPDALNELILLIKEHKEFVFASKEDADYFRKAKKPVLEAVAKPISPPPVLPKILPQPKPVEKIEQVHTNRPTYKLEPLAAKELTDFSQLKKILSNLFPQLAIISEIPDDTLAKKLSERWKTKNSSAPISILSFQEPIEQKALLENIAVALDVYFAPAKIIQAETIEKEKQWDAFLSVPELKVIIVCDYSLWQMSSLMKFYKEMPSTGVRMLKNTPLFLLPNLSLYLKDPTLKRSLWKALCQKLS